MGGFRAERDFRPEDDFNIDTNFDVETDFKPDNSDRRPSRSGRSSPAFKMPSFPEWRFPISRQHVMVGVGIIVLLLLIFGISSALNSSSKRVEQSSAAREISLPNAATSASTAPSSVQSPQNTQPTSQTAVKDIAMPGISPTPTEATASVPQGQNRVELSGSLADAVATNQNPLATPVENLTGPLPTEPATLSSGKNVAAAKNTAATKTETAVADKPAGGQKTVSEKATTSAEKTASKPKTNTATTQPSTSKPVPVVRTEEKKAPSTSSLQNVPASHFTLQLSGASRPENLNKLAKENRLTNYWVYETRRSGKPWFVLVSGNYVTSAEAKSAVANLPAEVRSAQPWVKSIRQVQQESQQR